MLPQRPSRKAAIVTIAPAAETTPTPAKAMQRQTTPASITVPAAIRIHGTLLPRAVFRRDPRAVAPELLNKVLVSADGRTGRIVEVEAYCGAEDPAAHSYRGRTARNATMFGPAGHMYVYFTYGMHWCCNAVCGEVGEGAGVLIRALEPVAGVQAMRAARPAARRDRDLCSGPARLTQALGISGVHDGIDLVSGRSGFAIVDDGTLPPPGVNGCARIGVSRGVDLPWRWYVPHNAHVSKR
jgi:DNA-3-methyladenine glycosylase